ncbi:FUSC family protein [Corynebacterium qintianiae]|uniref:FUSC family protein n=1 Tax=Corynebacterium qintianiae TaxID=2709392 RepID=UPI0013EBD5B7|nr:FUSC family protein [Corynebacterium qintianiae]
MAKERMGTRARLKSVDLSLGARATRVRKRLLPILQTALAAGIAYWIASEIFGHAQPFFAPISVIIIIGMTGGERITKAGDISLGCILGVLVGDLLFYRIGAGGWQIAVIVAGALLIASFFSRSQLVNNQVAIGSVLIATIMPPGGEVTGIDRTVDAFVGAAVAMVTLALIPQGPVGTARREIAKVMELMSSVLDDVADGLRGGGAAVIDDALESIRGSQNDIDAMSTALASGAESARLSPFLWGSRRYVHSLELVIPPVDTAIRTTRVLARRAHILCGDRDEVSPEQIALIDALAKVCLEISDIYEVNSRKLQSVAIPRIVNELRVLGGRTGMDVIPDGGVLSAYVILAQTRSLIVDLLQVCGMSRESAAAVLTPTSTSPKYPPERYV